MKTFQQYVLGEAFTRQHYIAIADVIAKEIDKADPATEDALIRVAETLATMFKNDNPRFDKGLFLAKCGA
jgi:hypothetical protein